MGKAIRLLLSLIGSIGFFLLTGDGSESLLLLIFLVFITYKDNKDY